MSENILSLNFRENEVLFKVKEIKGGADKVSKSYRSDIEVNIYGADTESVLYEDSEGLIYEPQCSTVSDPFNGDYIIWHKPRSAALYDLLKFFLKNYGPTEFKNGNKKCIIYYHNLEYDWLQLVKQVKDLLTLSKTGIYKANKWRQKNLEEPEENKDYFIGALEDNFIFLRDNALFVGSAPHFTFRIHKTERLFFDITFMDTFSFFKGSLESVAKELKLPLEKQERQKDLGKIDYRLSPDDYWRKIEFEHYAKSDAKITRLAGESIREIHKMAGLLKFRVSSPSFAIQMLFKQLKPFNTVLNGIHHVEIMNSILSTYRGGRTGGITHGKVPDLSVLDFASSYPAAMLSLPSFSPSMKYIKVEDKEALADTEGIIKEIIKNPNCFITLDGEEKDSQYPALIAHNKRTKKLTPIFGKFENIPTTGYEFLCGYKSGSLSITQIREITFLVDTEPDIQKPFADFARLAFKGKQESEKGSILYTMWKLVLNGAYGKLIESRKKVIASVEHEQDLIPYMPQMEQEFHAMFYDEYLRCMRDGLEWEKVYLELYDTVMQNFPREQLKYCAFADINIGGKDFGSYAVPGAASLITGIARARLRALMKCTAALYWDTDSVFIENLQMENLEKQLKKGSEWLPKNVVPLLLGSELGQIDCELLNGTGYLAGTKRYYIVKEWHTDITINKKFKTEFILYKKKIKSAIHGLPSLPKEEIERMITYLATNEGIGEYFAKEKPLKGKEAPNNRLIGAFIAKEKAIRSLYNRDDRLHWDFDTKNNRYNGHVIEWEKFL